MEACEFIKLTVTNLSLTLPLQLKPSTNIIHPTSSPPFYCLIKLHGFPPQSTLIPLNNNNNINNNNVSAVFHLSKNDFIKKRRWLIFNSRLTMVIYVFTGVKGRLLGKVSLQLDEIDKVEFDGWCDVGNGSKLRVCIRVDPDPRFVFEFDGRPESSPVVFQSDGSVSVRVRQPVFSCKFSLRSSVVRDNRNHRIRSLQSEQGSGRGWLSSFGSERERPGKERKGWSITVHDLSGSPVAAASMVTPFVASPGSDRVSRSNPGSWLILRPGDGTWNPWGRLEAWRERERGTSDGVGFKFELIPDMSANSNSGVVLAETTLSTSKGGKFIIDLASPNGLWPFSAHRGFVMCASVGGEGKGSKPTVEVSVQHVSCTEDAAAFVALAAAIDLSIDACKLFSQKLRKELCQNSDLGG